MTKWMIAITIATATMASFAHADGLPDDHESFEGVGQCYINDYGCSSGSIGTMTWDQCRKQYYGKISWLNKAGQCQAFDPQGG